MSDIVIEDEQPVLTEEEMELQRKKEKAQKCKVIALHRMGHHPINANVSFFNQKSKVKLLEMVRALFENTDEAVNEEFNTVCLDVIFDEKQDVSTYPVYTLRSSPKESVMDLGGNIVE